jgi:hypothetical protein
MSCNSPLKNKSYLVLDFCLHFYILIAFALLYVTRLGFMPKVYIPKNKMVLPQSVKFEFFYYNRRLPIWLMVL